MKETLKSSPNTANNLAAWRRTMTEKTMMETRPDTSRSKMNCHNYYYLFLFNGYF